ncbi:Rrf2 family nitric oxide-sensitive transcriptional repressor [Rhodobium orientis]|uniref:Transcriptional regulator n=1 Tax=Rhodobium orientis TaxID=34017 RepID=A0A327JIS1_9HYPH|nr:Rrf2 family transcriptional regulator [Rhodobium orientis]MBB4305233.1 Rrf2 family nitric oxide-sensitive transcriptional repressor [Rhodobium orientis]MBK5952139.1 hypothetical protein [Rhodobium orientis]RAI26310.1 hypothetical protein CH339_14530 [Rhodobium orientis]
MRLTQQTDIALRILMYLAINRDEKTIIDDVVVKCLCPRPQAVKAIQSLRNGAYITSRKGRNGGIALARDPAEISVGEIVRTIETDIIMAECQTQHPAHCNIVETCLLKNAFDGAMGQFMHHLDNISIADITSNSEVLFCTGGPMPQPRDGAPARPAAATMFKC